MTHLTPQAFKERGACSREEPQPKLAPATTMSPGSTVPAKSASMSSIQWEGPVSSEIILANPAVAAASAVMGCVAGPRKL